MTNDETERAMTGGGTDEPGRNNNHVVDRGPVKGGIWMHRTNWLYHLKSEIVSIPGLTRFRGNNKREP
jgi:hypothetical protein